MQHSISERILKFDPLVFVFIHYKQKYNFFSLYKISIDYKLEFTFKNLIALKFYILINTLQIYTDKCRITCLTFQNENYAAKSKC